MCVRGGKNTDVMYLKNYNGQHKHPVGEMCQMGVGKTMCKSRTAYALDGEEGLVVSRLLS